MWWRYPTEVLFLVTGTPHCMNKPATERWSQHEHGACINTQHSAAILKAQQEQCTHVLTACMQQLRSKQPEPHQGGPLWEVTLTPSTNIQGPWPWLQPAGDRQDPGRAHARPMSGVDRPAAARPNAYHRLARGDRRQSQRKGSARKSSSLPPLSVLRASSTMGVSVMASTAMVTSVPTPLEKTAHACGESV